MALLFDDDDLPARERDAFAVIYVDVSIPALHQRSRIGLKMRPSTAPQMFNALAKMEETLFEELGSDVASVASADYEREFSTMRETAVASCKEWQSFVDDWKGSLLTRLEDVGNELEAARAREANLKHQLDEKDGRIAALLRESRALKCQLKKASARKMSAEAPQGQSGVAGFFLKLTRRDSKESMQAFQSEADEDHGANKRFSLSDTVKAGISSIAMLTRANSTEVHGLLPGQAAVELPGEAVAEDFEEDDDEEELQVLLPPPPPPKEVRDASAQACAKDAAVAHVGVQCFLRETCDFSSLMMASRSAREEREARKSLQGLQA